MERYDARQTRDGEFVGFADVEDDDGVAAVESLLRIGGEHLVEHGPTVASGDR